MMRQANPHSWELLPLLGNLLGTPASAAGGSNNDTSGASGSRPNPWAIGVPARGVGVCEGSCAPAEAVIIRGSASANVKPRHWANTRQRLRIPYFNIFAYPDRCPSGTTNNRADKAQGWMEHGKRPSIVRRPGGYYDCSRRLMSRQWVWQESLRYVK